MSLTQERINEIALECSLKYKDMDNIHDGSIQAFANDFLSRIREKQEAVAWMNKDGNFVAQVNDGFFVVPLFTIPPAAPESDCKELVETLELFVWPYQESHKYTDTERTEKAKVVLAKHKKKGGGE